jgi:hypothetical protein
MFEKVYTVSDCCHDDILPGRLCAKCFSDCNATFETVIKSEYYDENLSAEE